jgi:hypothetical protein
MGISDEQLDKELAEAELRLDAICAMNGGKLPANWPVNPTSPRDPLLNPSDEQSNALEKEAQRRINAVRAANGGQLPPDWKEHVAANRP